jgi:hypothetical protein
LPPKIANLYAWLDLVVNGGLAFGTVEQPLFRKYTKMAPISRNTFMKTMHEVVLLVEEKIRKMLPELLAIVFDGWTMDNSSTHYVGIFAAYANISGMRNCLHSDFCFIL